MEEGTQGLKKKLSVVSIFTNGIKTNWLLPAEACPTSLDFKLLEIKARLNKHGLARNQSIRQPFPGDKALVRSQIPVEQTCRGTSQTCLSEMKHGVRRNRLLGVGGLCVLRAQDSGGEDAICGGGLRVPPRGEAAPCPGSLAVDALSLGRQAREPSPGEHSGAATQLEPLLLLIILHFVRLKF